jgi:protein-tyrosine phosphatase
VSQSSSMEPGHFRLLVVCTRNVCRSPAAEAYLRDAFPPSTGVEVSSAGLYARVGEPVAGGTARLLDVPLPGFSSRQVTAEMIEDADLVLSMTREQRAALVTTVPAAVRRTFTLREFAELAVLAREYGAEIPSGSPAHSLVALTALVPRYRSLRRAGDGDDIADPYGRDHQEYARAMLEVRTAVTAMVSAVHGRSIIPDRDLQRVAGRPFGG